ncbi:MAG: hypothetical protein H0T44_01325 [Gemmatimonadales bacterium]|nr:hypothetical protein [Gemmatimonadales bacterium]
MVWRVLEYAERQWSVSIAAERRANSPHWNLVFSFRGLDPGQHCFWSEYPLSSSSRAALFAQAERIPDQTLTDLLAEHLD